MLTLNYQHIQHITVIIDQLLLLLELRPADGFKYLDQNIQQIRGMRETLTLVEEVGKGDIEL